MSTIRQSFNTAYQAVAGDVLGNPMNSYKYSRHAMALVLVGALCAGGFYGYRWYAQHREQAAHKIFAECVHEYERAQKNPAVLPNAEQVFKAAYEKHSSSRLAPYFLVYRADILIQQKKLNEAVQVMSDALRIMPTSSPVYNLYMTKRALMRIDLGGQEKETGLQELTNLAHDAKNNNRDMALYYLGLYHWSNNELFQARKVWQELVAMPKQDDQQGKSAWADIVADKLNQIV